MMDVAFINARLVDPAAKLDAPGALLVRDGRIADAGPRVFNDGKPAGAQIIDCNGQVLAPGLIDMRVFVGEPGAEHRETIESAGLAAAAGGVTTMVLMPATDPVIDEAALVAFMRNQPCAVNVLPMAALTKGRKGEQMTEMVLLSEAGAIGFTDADRTIADARVMRRALSYAATFDLLVAGHCEEPSLSHGASATEGEIATRLGLSGAPALAETIIVERDLRLVELTGARYHFAQVTTQSAIEAIASAKARGLPVTCGVPATHVALNALDIAGYLTFRKLSPPLRTEDDRRACVEALAAGIIDVIVSSHDPQAPDTKRLPYAQAAAGGVGLETLLPITLELVHAGHLTMLEAIARLTAAPASILGLGNGAGTLSRGAVADLVCFNPDHAFIVDGDKLRSRAKNTPFDGRKTQGRVMHTWVKGKCVHNAEATG